MHNNLGLIGLGVMGSNLALNIADHGFKISLYNYTPDLTDKFDLETPHPNAVTFRNIQDFVDSLELPRKIMIMVTAGKAVDATISSLLPYLDKGDIIMDLGNSNYEDTIVRGRELESKGFYFLGVGVSGGASGARFGPAIMPGGSKQAYDQCAVYLESIAARAGDGSPCCALMGNGGAGHFVKMVHNGIEYADMQLISETYLILKKLGGFSNRQIAQIFHEFNQGKLKSYLIGITADVIAQQDPKGKGELIDVIKDCAGQKGTGKWTAVSGMELGCDLSMIDAACNARFISGKLEERKQRAQALPCVKTKHELDIKSVENCLYLGKIAAYAQGFDHYSQASKLLGFNLNLGKIASIFRAGCIIQAEFLNRITEAYDRKADLLNLIDDQYFKSSINECIDDARNIVALAIANGVPIPALSTALSYLDALQSECLGANLIQGLRDYFGAHTFVRTGSTQAEHHEWKKLF